MDNLNAIPTYAAVPHMVSPQSYQPETSHEPSSHGAIFFGAGRAR